MSRRLALRTLPGRYRVCRLEPDDPVPDWARGGGALHAVTRTAHELSLVCPEESVPEDVLSSPPFGALEVQGPLDFAETGILAALAQELARAGISVFALSTYDTDYLLVPAGRLSDARQALRADGHQVD